MILRVVVAQRLCDDDVRGISRDKATCMASLQVTLDIVRIVEGKREAIDIERLVSSVPTAKAVYGDKFGSMMVEVDDAHRGALERAVSDYCTVETFQRLDPYDLQMP